VELFSEDRFFGTVFVLEIFDQVFLCRFIDSNAN
jgi:hypothetical protein